MEVVFAIDLYHGQIVHAVAGQRQYYRPFSDTTHHSLVDFVSNFIHRYPIKKVYIADLDAIEQQGNHSESIVQLSAVFPSLTFWIDQGVPPISCLEKECSNKQYIIGSETNISPAELEKFVQCYDVILSLDFSGMDFIGDQSVLKNIDLWPKKIIVMSLAHIGLTQGPDYALIEKIKMRAGDRKVYVAGGVRDVTDLRHLSDLGVAGVLVATALHNQSITPDFLHDLI